MSLSGVAFAVLFVIVGVCKAAPPRDSHGNSTTQSVPQVLPAEAINFMRNFGYLEKGSENAGALISENTIIDAIRLVQRYGGLAETGILDATTSKLMKSRRCGCPDILPPHQWTDSGRRPTTRSRRKRFVIASPGWRKRNLHYKMANWSSKMNKEEMEAEVERALSAWATYSRLKFVKVHPQEDADITILFGYQRHNDEFPFDGPGGVLAHAFYPYERSSYSGQVHFDEEEPWVINATTEQIYGGAVDFYRVAVHELGHSLGLGHSHVTSSIMFPYYQAVNGAFVLGDDDVRAMHELYIRRTLEDDNESDFLLPAPRPTPRHPPSTTPRTTTMTPRTTTTTTTRPRKTRPSTRKRTTTTTTLRPIPTTTRKITYTYENDSWTPDEHFGHDKHDHGPDCNHPHHRHPYPNGHNHDHWGWNRPTSVRPPGVDSSQSHDTKNESVPDICAGSFNAAAVLRGELFIFKGTYLWRLRERGHIMDGYPALISAMFTKLPKDTVIDAAYQRPTDGNIVLFSGRKMWVYTGSEFLDDRPRPLTDVALPPSVDRLDAAMVWAKNGATYFFRGKEFYRYNETTRRMEKDYPMNITERWSGMPSNIDAALTWKDGLSYFFKGYEYWEFDNVKGHSSPRSPQSAVNSWIGC